MRAYVCACMCFCACCGVKVIMTEACVRTVAVKRERSLRGHCSKKALPHFCAFLGVGVEKGFESEYLYSAVSALSVGEAASAAPSRRSSSQPVQQHDQNC